MAHIDSCYFCTSPFQLFSIIALAYDRKEKADLYIDPQFGKAREYGERLSETGLFEDVILIDQDEIYTRFFNHRQGLLNHFEIAFNYLRVDQITGCFLKKDTVYSRMFVSSRAFLPRLVQLRFLKHKQATRILYFDDGVGSYYGDEAYQPKKTDRIVRRVLFGRKANDLNHERYLFRPDLYRIINPGKKVRLHRIRPFYGNAGLENIINDVFQMDKAALIREKGIIIDTLKDELFTEPNREKLKNIYHAVIDAIGPDNTIIKRHPRDTEEEEPGIRYYKDQGIPFECVCLNEDMSESVLISYGSTAVSTPKMLMDQEPYVILLYNLVKMKTGQHAALDGFFRGLAGICRKGKVFIPDNPAELKEALDMIVNGSNEGH